MHKPVHTLVFAVLLFAALALLSGIVPGGGFRVSEHLIISYPQFAELFDLAPKKSITDVIRAADEADSTMVIVDTAAAVAEPPVQKKRSLMSGIQLGRPDALNHFFNALDELKTEHRSIRVLHYGDSQIEGDRITGFLRTKLQEQFGGSGAGFFSLMPLTNSPDCSISTEGAWDRYNAFLAADKRVAHKNYGVLGGFCRYMDYAQVPPSSVAQAAVNIRVAATAPPYNRLKLFYGGAKRLTWCEFYDGPALMNADSLAAGGNFNIMEFPAGSSGLPLTLKFRGTDSPDFYGISLEGEEGVMVDNIAMRGSSGTFFHQLDHGQIGKFYNHLNVKLIILQFGGNTVPAIRDSAMAANYGNYIRFQLSQVRKLAPGASILFIGPSDMSMKSGTEYITYPLLPAVRDAIRKAVFASGAAFFDLYDCMGGMNSMPLWVEEKLAAADYTHFSPQGARKIAKLLYAALITEYNNHLAKKQ